MVTPWFKQNLAIKTVEGRKQRSEEIEEFVKKYGRGDQGLTEAHRKARIEKVLGPEKNKLSGYGKDPKTGAIMQKISQCYGTDTDPAALINFDAYPKDIRSETGKHRILSLVCGADGAITIHGIHKDGKEKSKAERVIYGVDIPGDQELLKLEKKQLIMGTLKEVSDRTLPMHTLEHLSMMLESDVIDTDKDKINQY